ncbi:hypothetical protein ACPXCE_09665 [Streptomyces sp. DT24]|uniref:hypothetical protein n=1 Tax=Streptomyces sp. DT24 TaxID=3416520 RepID=UPI003CF90861
MTLQLDVGRQLSQLPKEPEASEGSDGPVFVDESGRRSKTFRRLGWVLTIICACYAVTLVVSVLGGNSSAPWLPISGQPEKKTAPVEVEPDPSLSSDPASPGVTPSATLSTSSVSPSTNPSGSSSAAHVPKKPGGSGASSSVVVPPKGGTGGGTKPTPGASDTVSSPGVSTPPVEPPTGETSSAPGETVTPPEGSP